MTKQEIKEKIEELEDDKTSLQGQINALEDEVDKIRKKLNALEDALWLIEEQEDAGKIQQPILTPTVDEFFKMIQAITYEYANSLRGDKQNG
jgi:predicted nuclease with TOPRIM domain